MLWVVIIGAGWGTKSKRNKSREQMVKAFICEHKTILAVINLEH